MRRADTTGERAVICGLAVWLCGSPVSHIQTGGLANASGLARMRKGQPFASHISEGAGCHTSTNTSRRAGTGGWLSSWGGIPQPTHMGGYICN